MIHDLDQALAALPLSPAALAVLALRQQQVDQFGHTPDADLRAVARHGRPAIAKLARVALSDAIEDMQFNKSPDQIRRRLVKAAALLLAAIEAEDALAPARTAPFQPERPAHG